MDLKEYRLGELLDVTRGTTLSGEYYATEGEHIRLTLGNFDYNNAGFKENTSKDNLYFTGTVREEFILKEGDIITPLTEQTFGLIGSTAMIPESSKYIQSQDIGLVKCNKELLLPEFCYYLLPTKLVKGQLSAGAQQTSIRHTSPDKIKACKVLIPGIEEQKRIASLLSVIDKKIKINRAINQKLEAMAKQLYDYWFVQFDFPDENGCPYKSSGGKMVWNEQLKREIPEGWKCAKLIDIANITMGQSPAGESYNEDGNGVIFYQGSTDFGLRFPKVRKYTTEPSRYAKAGDILMSVRAPVGATNIASNDCCIGRGLSAINSKIGSVTYIYEIISDFKTRFDQMNSSGTTFGSITKDELYNLPCVKPNQGIVDAFEEVCSPIFNSQISIGKEIEYLIVMRDTLLPLLMSGQVTIK